MDINRESFMAANAIVNLEPIFENLVTTNFCQLPGSYNIIHIRTLYLLQNVGALTLSEIAKHHHVSKQHISQIIPAMEQLGIVRRFRKENDLKSVYVNITDTGTKVLEDYIFTASEELADTLSIAGTDDLEQILICCNKLRSILERLQQEKNSKSK